MRITC